MTEIYLDSNATTELDNRVLEEMIPALRHTGNPSSAHFAGQIARRRVEKARDQVSALLGASPREIVFTSGSTEANNLALKGIYYGTSREKFKIVSATTEHPAILETLGALAADGAEVVLVPVDREGIIDLERLRDAVDERTKLVTVMAANNETGVTAPLAEISSIAHRFGALVHTDATQLLAWGGINAEDLGVDVLSLSSHKMHGPQGVGALYVSRDIGRQLAPVQHGGGHERGMRSGTLNTAGIVGFGAAADIAVVEGPSAAKRVRKLRDQLHETLRNLVPPVSLNGHFANRLPGTLNLSFAGADADAIMAGIPNIAVSSGSACSTGYPAPSHVLRAMGIDDSEAACSLRFGLSRFTKAEEIGTAAELISDSVERVRYRKAEAVSR